MFVAWLLLAGSRVAAEPSEDEYRSQQPAPTSQAERQRLQEALDAARLRAERERAEHEQAARAEQARQAAEWARQPLAVRLMQQRCTGCHGLQPIEALRQGPLGWRWTVERMRWWHGAPLQRAEAALLSQHLWQQQGAGRQRMWLELGAVMLTLLAGAALVVGLGWRWAARRKAAQGRSE
jgi:hypothetical protein